MPKRRALFLSLFLLISTLIPAHADNPSSISSAWPPMPRDYRNSPLLGYHWGIVDSFSTGAQALSLIQVPQSSNNLCNSFDEPACSEGKRSGWFTNAVMPPCDNSITTNCIEGLNVETSDGNFLTYKLVKLASAPTWKADDAHANVVGSAPSLWSPSGQNEEHGLIVNSAGAIAFSNTSDTKHGVLTDIKFSIRAYKKIIGPSYQPLKACPISPGLYVNCGNGGPDCMWQDTGECGVRDYFVGIKKITLNVLLDVSVNTSWMFGRLGNGNIKVLVIDGNRQRITITGEPINIPLFAFDIPLDKLPLDVVEYMKTKACTVQPTCSQGYAGGNSESSSSFSQTTFEKLSPFLGDTASISIPTWSVSNFYLDQNYPQLCQNLSDIGLVTTNASIYDGGPPRFDGQNLIYRVAALHKTEAGEIFKGSYSLQISSRFARCLFNLTNAPVKAVVEVIDNAGTKEVTTTSFKEQDGQMIFAVNGFTFSSPTIQVRLLQDQVLTPTTSPSPTAFPTPAATPTISTASPSESPKVLTKIKSIMCVKGKLTKKISGTNPKCPSGYKQK